MNVTGDCVVSSGVVLPPSAGAVVLSLCASFRVAVLYSPVPY